MPKQDEQGREIRVTSHDQRGGITAGIVNIQAASPPKITLSGQTHTQTEDGHLYEALLTVDTRYVIPNLRVEAHADFIRSLDVVPQASGMFVFGHTGKRSGFHFTTLQNAAGRYKIKVATSEPEKVRIDLG